MSPKSSSEQSPNSRRGARSHARWAYDEERQILFVSHPDPVTLETQAEMRAYFDYGIGFWREQCNGRRLYVVVDYENLTTSHEELEFYASQAKRVMDEIAITIIRYNGTLLQRMAGRMTALALHTTSKTYGSLEEALEVVRGLQRGTISIHPPRP